MRRTVVIQPNGLYAIYSPVADTFTDYNLTKEDVISYYRNPDFRNYCFDTRDSDGNAVLKENCDSNSIYDLPKDVIPVMKLADAITHVLANNETTESFQKILREMGYKYWNRIVLGSGDTPKDVDYLLKRINIDIAKILYHYNVSLQVKDGKIVVKDEIYAHGDGERFKPIELNLDFETAQKENFYYTD